MVTRKAGVSSGANRGGLRNRKPVGRKLRFHRNVAAQTPHGPNRPNRHFMRHTTRVICPIRAFCFAGPAHPPGDKTGRIHPRLLVRSPFFSGALTSR
jgi:hypothetical protein